MSLIREIIIYSTLALFTINILFGLFVVFFEKKNPGAIWAWLMVFLIVPCFGFMIYLILGFEGKKHKVFEAKYHNDISLHEQFVNKYPQFAQDEKILNTSESIIPFKNTQYLNNFITMNKASGKSIYRQNNDIKLYHEGNSKFADLFQDIANAKHFIHIQYYIFRDDKLGTELMKLLADKAKEGLEVHVIYDGMGNYLNKPKFKRILTDAGGKLRIFLPPRGVRVNFRNHRKIAIIDGAIGYVGGLNIGNEYIGKKKKFGFWRDTHIRVYGNAVKDLELRFIMDWNSTKGQKMELKSMYFPSINPTQNINMQIISSGPDTKWNNIHNSFFKMVTEANKYLYIATPYFVPDDSLLVALKSAALSGIDVRIIIPKKPDHLFVHSCSLSYMGELLEAGVRCYEYTKGFIHAKVMLMDGMVSTIGTANMDIRSFSLNFEVNSFIYDKDIGTELEKQFNIDFKYCSEITIDDYNKRSFFQKFKEAFSRLLSPLL